MTALRLYNTLSRREEDFVPLDPLRVRLYVCGPTVYDYAHIGNARPAVVFDVLFRLLQHRYGTDHVVYARNITDVDDKIIAASRETGEPIERVTARTTAAYHQDMGALGVLAPTIEPRATQHIGEMVELIQRLIAKGHAYAADGQVLFHVPSMADYGQLSRLDRDELVAGARVDVAAYKRDPADFTLWKPSTPDQPGWDSPWGRGRPGWHIECSAMSWKHLGEVFDIHGGGLDLIFPHHENEIAQSTCAHHGAPFVRYWMHNGYLTVNGEKMSKSAGNFFTVRDLLNSGWRGESIRVALLSTHYRAPLDFTVGRLQEFKLRLDKWYRALKECGAVEPIEPDKEGFWWERFFGALCDDLNTSGAMNELDRQSALIFNPAADEDEPTVVDSGLATLSESTSRAANWQAEMKGRLLAMGRLLGVLNMPPETWFKGNDETTVHHLTGKNIITGAPFLSQPTLLEVKYIEEMIAKRKNARTAKDFAEADRVRAELLSKHVVLEDKPDGTTEWRRE
jgi:cysteinyl-tRNA synthetase